MRDEFKNFSRAPAGQAEVSMRELDRALWQYSYEKRPKS